MASMLSAHRVRRPTPGFLLETPARRGDAQGLGGHLDAPLAVTFELRILDLDDLFRHRRRYGFTMRSKALQVQGHRLADAAQRLLTCGTLADATGE